MARQDTLQTNFSGGELSPLLYGRPDLAKYADSVKRARDVVMLQHGGFTGRPGTDYIGEVKDSSKFTRLVPFVYSTSAAYVLEFGDGYMRVWKDGAVVGGGSPYEIATPYATADLEPMDYTQGADTMFLARETKMPHRLQRFADNRWSIGAAPFDPLPFDAIGTRHNVSITLGAAALGATTASASGSVFLASDVGRSIAFEGGNARITAVTAPNSANVTVTAAFNSASLPAMSWVLTGSPQATCTPSAAGPVGAIITLDLDIDGWRTSDGDKHSRINGGIVKVEGYASDIQVTGTVIA